MWLDRTVLETCAVRTSSWCCRPFSGGYGAIQPRSLLRMSKSGVAERRRVRGDAAATEVPLRFSLLFTSGGEARATISEQG